MSNQALYQSFVDEMEETDDQEVSNLQCKTILSLLLYAHSQQSVSESTTKPEEIDGPVSL